jgi:hypothetical protein
MEILIILAVVVGIDLIARRRGHDSAAMAAASWTRRNRGVTSL